MPDLGSVAGAQQLLARAARTALACDTSLAQARTLATIALAAAKLLEVGELADQLQELEARASRLAAPRRHLSPMLRIRRS